MVYLPFVDGLRAIAIIAVVVYHALPWALPGGFAGVDVFFVISGFLITRFIVAEMTDGTFSLTRFFVRRARRLLPAAIACFLIVSVLAGFVLLPDAYWYFGRSLLSSVLMYANIFFYNTGGYFTAPALEKPLLHTWSLAVEDQFYLTWPLILLAMIPRWPRAYCIVACCIMLFASLAFAEFKIINDPEYAFFLLPTRAWELLIGAALALAAPGLVFSRWTAQALAELGAVAVLASFALLTPASHFPGLGALAACLGTAAIIAGGLSSPENFVARALSVRAVVFVGLISYSLYLWHWPLIALTSYSFERPLTALEAAVVVAVSFVLAVVSWRFVEMPFRKTHSAHPQSAHPQSAPAITGMPAADRQFVLRAVGGVGVALCVAMALKLWKGVPERYAADVRTVLEQMVSGNPLRSRCDDHHNIFKNDDICNFGRRKAEAESYEVALFGDSMADHWSPLVAKFASEMNLAGRQVTNGGCGLLFGTEIPAWPLAKARECATYQAEAEKFVAINKGMKIAVISGFWEKWLGRLEHPEQRLDVPVATSQAEAKGQLAPTFDKVWPRRWKYSRSAGSRCC